MGMASEASPFGQIFVSENICDTHSCSNTIKNSQIDSKMTCSMCDSNFFGVVEVVKRHARIADTVFFQTRYRTFSTKELKFSDRRKCTRVFTNKIERTNFREMWHFRFLRIVSTTSQTLKLSNIWLHLYR